MELDTDENEKEKRATAKEDQEVEKRRRVVPQRPILSDMKSIRTSIGRLRRAADQLMRASVSPWQYSL